MSTLKQFTIGGVAYNVVRASAVQQDEALSMLNSSIIEKLGLLQMDEPADSDFAFNFFAALPFSAKQRLDQLLLSRVTKHGSETLLDSKDFDGKVMELNQLRGEVLLWNFEPFFVYWASAIKSALDGAKKAREKASQTG